MFVSRVMSTQHPDNVKSPFFAKNHVFEGDDEVKEAFYAFSHLDCKEQLWDCEGKEVDNFVVKKLLSRYDSFFEKKKLGEDVFITLRVPNPSIEKNEAKILLETLESIPRSFDVGKLFYNADVAPIFEVCQPMTSSHKELLRISEYYKKFVVGKQHKKMLNNDLSVAEWVGELKPDSIRLTPLIEDKESMLNSHEIVEKYMEEDKVKEIQRVWLARSDPALNYGNLAAVLIEKIALQRLHKLQERTSVEILPILGCGSAPFRGNLKPTNVSNILKGYPSVQTFTLQSAFKYDYDSSTVKKAVQELNDSKRKNPIVVDETECLAIIEKLSSAYQSQVKVLAETINNFSQHVPKRRKRKLHIGLFGYSRATAGVTLPRAIGFCASLYSLGLPPEILGLDAVSEQELERVSDFYPSFENDLKDSLKYLNKKNLEALPVSKELLKVVERYNFEVDEEHEKMTTSILKGFSKGKEIQEEILRAGEIRGFLG